MGCLCTKLNNRRQKSSKKVPNKEKVEDRQLKSTVTSDQPLPRLTGEEILQQLRDEGLVPDSRATGGVAFSVHLDTVPRGKPPRRLERLPTLGLYTAEERQIIADVYRFDRFVEQVQKKALDREVKHKIVKDEKKRRQFVKEKMAEHQLQVREERLKKEETEGRTGR